MKRNAFFLIIDALRYDAVADPNVRALLMPTLSQFVNEGVIKSLTTNGQVTQFVAPSIFTSTYPLDFGGYNSGLLNRPASFVELMKNAGLTTCMFEGHDIDGPHGAVERGFGSAEVFYDKRLLLEGFLKKRMLYDIKRWRAGEYTDDEIIKIAQESYDPILAHLQDGHLRRSRGWQLRRLGRFSTAEVKQVKQERLLLSNDPMRIIKKIEHIPPYFYFSYLGNKRGGFGLKLRNKVFGILKKVQARTNRMLGLDLKVIPSRPRIPPLAAEVLDRAATVASKMPGPWFIYAHIMDPHDHDIITRPWNMFTRLRHLPRVIKARRLQQSSGTPVTRAITYDLSLAYVDKQLDKLRKRLKASGALENTVFFFTGDHGEGWDKARDVALRKEFGYRTFREHITVPLIVSPANDRQTATGFHDSMSVGATILDTMNIPHHTSFKGDSIFESGKDAIITENCGRGNADIERRDIFFTVTGVTHKIMGVLQGSELTIEYVYDLKNDPRELINIRDELSVRPVINELTLALVNERKELLSARGYIHNHWAEQSAAKEVS
ncbi:MAG: sulfatase-like hydrolase/transferase [Rhodospirillales bacterium]|jgi:hypothetical protein|nr:sulfatase-like hydrolase/transferase [Rhodospirillales bacterium]MBT4626130.1 sulfatase-like hydrolase/transferase [Rhodospirillales bacterium]MBT5350232.1 sulfatase-like hydrolase/transferase [Rhodospirillales bacterium]MBT5522270.1 sulfatase-like hydrolase/transferase [Rhodospirillales bacterium]MBT6109389.1 sulfatase-like hydrolase/transferase [Rhodospirillales bacterium]